MDHRESETLSGLSADRVIELDHGSPIPLYLQIKHHLARAIAAWDPRSDKFYTDSELCGMFRVSRMTVRQAVQELVDGGLVKRSRGIGTFVIARKMEERWTPFLGFRQDWQENDRPLSVDLLDYEVQPCPPVFAEYLGIARSAPVRYIRRLRSADATPIALEHRYLPLSIAAGLTQADVMVSIRRALWPRVEFGHGEIHIEVTSAGEEEVRFLNVPFGAPLMMRRSRFLTKNGLPVLAGYTVYRADLVRYSIHMPLSGPPDPMETPEDQDQTVRLRREVAVPGWRS